MYTDQLPFAASRNFNRETTLMTYVGVQFLTQ